MTTHQEQPVRTPPGAAAALTNGVAADAGAVDAGTAAAEPVADRVWRNLCTFVLHQNERRKETADALGMSFFRVKALRWIAAAPGLRLSELAARLGTDRPYLTLVVDDLEARGLVVREQHPRDRRCKTVTVTAEGRAAAARANAILGTPPPGLATLPPEDLAALDRIVAALTAAGGAPEPEPMPPGPDC